MNGTMQTALAMLGVFFGVATATGCASAVQPSRTGEVATTMALDGRTFEVAIVSERGGAAENVELSFARGTVDASDARDRGYTQARYAAHVVSASSDVVEFEAEARGPSGARRLKGRIDGDAIVGTVMVVNDGAMPERYSFDGRAAGGANRRGSVAWK